jgi:hypothetical protein
VKRALALAGVAVIALAMAVGLAGCNWSSHTSSGDPNQGGPGSHGRFIQEPVGYRNVSFSCNGTVGVYVTSRSVDGTGHDSAIAVLADDPNCKP